MLLRSLPYILVGLLAWATIALGDLSDSGAKSAAGRRSGGFPYFKTVILDNVDGIALNPDYNSGEPLPAAYGQNLFVARDLDGSGTIDSVGSSLDYVQLDGFNVFYMTSDGNADTLWVKLYDNAANLIQYLEITTGATTETGLQKIWPFPYQFHYATFYVGNNTAAGDEWVVSAYGGPGY